MTDRVINFGYWVLWKQRQTEMTLPEFAAAAKIDYRNMLRIVWRKEKPTVNPATLGGIARVLGMSREAVEKEWQSTPVPVPTKKDLSDRVRREFSMDRSEYEAFKEMADAHGLTVEAMAAKIVVWVAKNPEKYRRLVEYQDETDEGAKAENRRLLLEEHESGVEIDASGQHASISAPKATDAGTPESTRSTRRVSSRKRQAK